MHQHPIAPSGPDYQHLRITYAGRLRVWTSVRPDAILQDVVFSSLSERSDSKMAARFPVFVVGSPRSGTSILVDVLISAGYHGFREGNFLPLIATINATIGRHFKVFGGENAPVLASKVDQAKLKRRISLIFKDIVESLHPVSPWFDKSGNPEMLEIIPHIQMLWPDCVFIFAKRRGIENISSRLKKFPGHDFNYHCADWARNMAAWRNVRAQMSRDCYIEVDQQDMIKDPGDIAQRIATFLHLNEDQAAAIVSTMSGNRPQETAAGSASRVFKLETVGWSEHQIAIFKRMCDAEMQAFGYSYDDKYYQQG